MSQISIIAATSNLCDLHQAVCCKVFSAADDSSIRGAQLMTTLALSKERLWSPWRNEAGGCETAGDVDAGRSAPARVRGKTTLCEPGLGPGDVLVELYAASSNYRQPVITNVYIIICMHGVR